MAAFALLRPRPVASPLAAPRAVAGSARIEAGASPRHRDRIAVARTELGRGPGATSTAQHTRVLSLGWGTGPDQVGRRRDPEAAAEGPMALGVGRDGSVYVLDQINGRVLRRGKDGAFGKPIAIGTTTAQDLLVDATGGVTVLDRLGEHTLKRYAPDGELVAQQTLGAIGVREAGGTTGLYEGEDGALYVEESLAGEGRRVLRPLTGGEPLPGRPSRDGRGLVAAAIVDGAHGRFVVRGLSASGAVRWETPLSVERRLLSIILLDTDVRGEIYAGVLHATTAAGSHDLVDERLELFRLDGEGTLIGQTSVAHPPSALENFRELGLGGPGVILWMHPLPDESSVAVDEIRF